MYIKWNLLLRYFDNFYKKKYSTCIIKQSLSIYASPEKNVYSYLRTNLIIKVDKINQDPF